MSALVRWIQSFHAIPGETVQFSTVHDIDWDPKAKTMSRTGSDPFIVFQLPAEAIPIRQVSFVFMGASVAAEGSFFIFQSSVDNPYITGEVTSTPGTFTVRGKLQDSTSLRLDLPDFLPRVVEFRRLVIQTPFANVNSWSFLLALASLGVAGGSLVLFGVKYIESLKKPKAGTGSGRCS